MCCGVVDCCSHTAHICIHDEKLVTRYKDVTEINLDCNGNSSAHVQGRRQLDLVIRSMYVTRDLKITHPVRLRRFRLKFNGIGRRGFNQQKRSPRLDLDW